MTLKLLAGVLRWMARILGVVLVALTVLIAIGEGLPNPLTQPFIIQIGFYALGLVLLGILLAWRWEFSGGMISLVGWVVFLVAEEVSVPQAVFILLLGVPSFLSLGSAFLRRHLKKRTVVAGPGGSAKP